MRIFNRILLIALLAAILVCIGAIIYLSLTPQPSDKFTEFYLLNQDGKASDYPREIKAGQPVTVILGVVNHETNPATYKVQIMVNGATINTLETGNLLNNQKLERKIDITLNNAGANQRVEFYLFMNNQENPHIKDPLVLIVNVAGG
jgi:uncharacterized membrane protein